MRFWNSPDGPLRMTAPDWTNLKPVAHRGLHGSANGIVENTSSAVTTAIDAGYNLEVDLQLSSDGRAMVFHDSTLDRLTRSTGRLVTQSAADLQKVAFRDTADPMMTLENLLELTDGRATLFLEIKSQWDNVGPLEQAVVKALDAYNGPVAVMSFDPASITAIQHLAPSLCRGAVAEAFIDDEARSLLSPAKRFYLRHLLHIGRSKPHFLAYNVAHLHYPAPQIATRLFKYPLLAWTVRTRNDLARAKRYGAIPIFEDLRP